MLLQGLQRRLQEGNFGFFRAKPRGQSDDRGIDAVSEFGFMRGGMISAGRNL